MPPPPPLGQPVLGGQLSGGRSIGAVVPVPIADGVADRPRASSPPNTSGQPPPPPPTGPSAPRTPLPPGSAHPRSTQAEPTKGGRHLLPIVAGVLGLLLVIGIISAALALTSDGGGSDTARGDGGGTLSGTPRLEVETATGQLAFTATFDGFAEGDRYAIMTAPTKDNFGPATAMTIPDVDDATGVGSYVLTVGSGSQQCGKVRVLRDDQRSGWSEIVCGTGGD